MSRRRMTDEVLARAIAMRERGLSLEQIGRRLGFSAKALSWHFLKHAVEKPKPTKLWPDHYLRCPLVRRGNHMVRAFTPEEDAQLVVLEQQGLRLSAIARSLNRPRNSVLGRLMTLARREEREAA